MISARAPEAGHDHSIAQQLLPGHCLPWPLRLHQLPSAVLSLTQKSGRLSTGVSAVAGRGVSVPRLARYRTNGFVNHSYTQCLEYLESCPSICGGTSFFIFFFSLKRGRFPLLPMSSLALRFSSWVCLLVSGVPTSAQRSFLAGSSPERGPAPYTLCSHQRSSVSVDIRMRL